MGGRLRDVVLSEQVTAAYDRVGADHNPKKGFSARQNFESWGTAIHGASGRVGANQDRLRQLSRLAAALALEGKADQNTLQTFTGSMVHPFSHRRCCFSVFQDIHTHTSALPPVGAFPLPPPVIDEVIGAMLVLPFASTDMRSPVSQVVSATDATPQRGGLCQATVSALDAQALFRTVEDRGEHTRMDWTLAELALRPSSLK